jgi:hypothetical protein
MIIGKLRQGTATSRTMIGWIPVVGSRGLGDSGTGSRAGSGAGGGVAAAAALVGDFDALLRSALAGAGTRSLVSAFAGAGASAGSDLPPNSARSEAMPYPTIRPVNQIRH